MKKLFMYVVVFIIAFVMSITGGCNSSLKLDNEYEADTSQTNNNLISSDYSNYKSLDELTIVYSIGPGGAQYKNTDEWTKYMSEKYGITLSVNYTTNYIKKITDIDNYVLYTTHEKFSGSGSNLFILQGRVPNTDSMESGTLNGFSDYLYELTSFYRLYNWENYVDSTLLEYFKKDNEIYVVPVLNSPIITPRYYNKQYIDEIGCTIPETIDEFYNYLIEVRKMYANDDHFYPMYTSANKAFSVLSDVFRAFNCYTDTIYNTTFAFNPQTNSFEDCVFSPDFEDALIYIRALQDQQLLYLVTNYHAYRDEILIEGKEAIEDINLNFATEYKYVATFESAAAPIGYKKEYKPQYETVEGYYLTGKNTTNLVPLTQDICFYTFPKDIKNIGGTVELFNDIFTNNENSYDLMYGIENEDYYINNNELVLGDPEDYFTNLQPLKKPDVSDADRILSNVPDALTYRVNTIFSIINFSNTSVGYEKNSQHSNSLLFDTDLPVEDRIEEYKENFKKLGDYKIIEELNEKLGLSSKYDY